MMNLKTMVTALLVTFSVTVFSQQQIPNIADPRLDFTLPDLKGNNVTLSSLKGKVVLLDFWASWCVPCRASNKQLVKLYNKYKDQGLEIIGVSLDDDASDWKKAVAKDKITWLQVNDPGGWDARAAIKWNIEAIPASFLVNKNGDVVAIDLEKNELEMMVKQLLGLN